MISNTCTRSKRVVVFILCGSVCTFLVQHFIFSSHKTDTSMIKTFQFTNPKPKKFEPVITKSPVVPLPGEVKDEPVSSQAPPVNQLAKSSPIIESLAHSPVQFQGNKDNPQLTERNIPTDVDKMFPVLPEQMEQSIPARLTPQLQDPNGGGILPNSNLAPLMQRPIFNKNSAPQDSISKQYFQPPMHGPVPYGNVVSQMQGFITNTNIAPQKQEVLPNGNIAQQVEGVVPNGNIAPQVQGTVPNENIPPQVEGVVLNGNIAPLVQGAVPNGNIAPQVQGAVPNGNTAPQEQAALPNGNFAPQMQGVVPNGNLAPQEQGVVHNRNIAPLVPIPNRNMFPVTSYETNNIVQSGHMMPEIQGFPNLPPPPGEVLDGSETTILRWNGSGWNQLHGFCAGDLNLKRTLLRSPAGQNAIIYIHDLNNDQYVSGSLHKHGLWDLPDVTATISNLHSDPDLGFIDIGAHVGTFSLVAALMGKKVVAVDPLVSNVIRFCKSVQANGLTDKITIFYTAISNSYKKVSFKVAPGNIGGTRIQEAPANVNTSYIYDPNYIDTVRLDDLVPYIPFKKAFIKMDVEEHEYEVVTSGVKFFQEIDVRGILMEWLFHKTGKNGLKLRDYMLGLNFRPFFTDGIMELAIGHYEAWPSDVLWKKM